MNGSKVPVTVLTGFLGSGKTTLLNRILSENHGKRIAVIENEFGEIGIDQALVINADEEIFEMNNGCICCTVRGDLIRILGNLMKRRDKFDHILVETTGMADPGPVAQTFFVDDEMREMFKLDGIVTMVDAKHVWLHIDESSECKEQIAFGDVIVLNKADLVTPEQLDQVEKRIRSMNALARVHRSVAADVPVPAVLDVGGFDLSRALEVKPTFLEPEYPFEWAGVFDLGEGMHTLALDDGPDPSMSLVIRPMPAGTRNLTEAEDEAVARLYATEERRVEPGMVLAPGETHWVLRLATTGAKTFPIRISSAGLYALYTQHLPEELSLSLRQETAEGVSVHAPAFTKTYAAAHTHDASVSSVGIRLEGAIDETKVNKWLSKLLRELGADIFRMKGILNVAGSDARFVFQAVHMLFDAREDRPWGDAPRASELVFIGRSLDRDALERGLRACLA